MFIWTDTIKLLSDHQSFPLRGHYLRAVICQGWEHIKRTARHHWVERDRGRERQDRDLWPAAHSSSGGEQVTECRPAIRRTLAVPLADVLGIHMPLLLPQETNKIKWCLNNLCIEGIWNVWEHRRNLFLNDALLHFQIIRSILFFYLQTHFQVKFF